MPGSALLPDKLFFRIGEVAGLVGVEPHVLRYWEREFRSIRPTKSKKGQRVYSRKDVENLLRVRDLLYREGFTIAGAKKKLQRQGLDPSPELGVEALEESPTSESRLTPAAVAHVPDEPAVQSVVSRREASASHRTTPNPVVRSTAVPAQMREQLHALRSEIEAFLYELDASPRS